MSSELIFFHKGLKYGERSALQQPGALQTCENITFTKEGEQAMRGQFSEFNSTALDAAIHSIKRFGDYLFIGEGTNLWWRDSAGEFRVIVDYTDFAELDVVADRIQDISATSFKLVSLTKGEIVHLTKDYGADYFAGSFTHFINLKVTAITNALVCGAIWGLSTAVDNTKNIEDSSDYYRLVLINDGGLYDLILQGKAGVSDVIDISSLTVGTQYYLKIVRSEEEGTLGLFVYSDATYNTLVESDASAITAVPSFRYLYACSGINTADLSNVSATITNLVLSQFGNYGTTNGIYSFSEYKNLLHMTNGTNRFFLDEDGNLFNAYVANPVSAPTLTAAAGAGKAGVYKGYVSYLITWPGGQTYETGLSTGSADVTTSGGNLQINWTSIPLCPYLFESGQEAPTITRKLYIGPGTGGQLGAIYYLAAVADNTTTTYTDNISDATAIANGVCEVIDYTTPPADPKYIVYHYSRLYMLPTANPHRLWYSEAPTGATASANENAIPLAFKSTNWDDLRSAGYGGKVDPQGLVSWGPNLYIPLKHTWIVKTGNYPGTWAYKKTNADIGISAPHTIAVCSRLRGILGLSTQMGGIPGLALFDGQDSTIITGPEFNYIFQDDLNQSYISKCRGAWDGRYYYLLYPNGSQTDVNKIAAFDLTRFPDIRLAMWEDLAPRCIDVYNQGSEIYIGGSDGKVRYNSGAETINIDIKTHDLTGEKAASTVFKKFKYLRYAIDSDDDDVKLEMIIDGTTMTWADAVAYQTISGSSDAIQSIELPQNFEGYKYSLNISGTGYSTFVLYSPWEIEYEVKR